jgi:hypothetical protein
MRALVGIALFSSLTAWAAPRTLTINQPIQDNDIINVIEEVETPALVASELDREFDRVSWETPPGNDILDPIPKPDDFNLPLPIPGPIGGGSETLVILEQIVNLGERIWKFVSDNKPVINIKRNYANALPKGVRSSEDLDAWSALQYRSYRMFGKNAFGAKVYDTTYTLIHRFQGNYDGQGNYIENATVLPHKVEALWGYTVEMGVENVGAVNVGSKTAPIGGLTMEMSFKVGTIVKASEFRAVYEFRGDRSDVTTIREDKQPGYIVD